MAYSTLVSNKPADPNERLTYRDMPTPLGEMRLVASPKGLRGAWFTDQVLLPSPEGSSGTGSIQASVGVSDQVGRPPGKLASATVPVGAYRSTLYL